jgi:hypothetical protein
MLLRFSAANFLSIAETQELSLVASKLKGHKDGLVPIPGTDLDALRSAVIYGANASGKTNFVEAFDFMQHAILLSHSHFNPGGGVPRVPFRLDPAKASANTALEAEFIVEGVRFQYGFECDDDKFTAEWLFSYPEGKRRRMFERSGQEVDFGSLFRGQKKILVDLMRPNSLFISTATQNDHEELSKIVAFFRKAELGVNVSVPDEFINNAVKKEQIDSRTIAFLAALGTGITGYRQVDTEKPETMKRLLNEFSAIARRHMGDGTAAAEKKHIRSHHGCQD